MKKKIDFMCQKLFPMVLALAILCNLAGCSGSKKTIDAETAAEEIEDLFGTIRDVDAYSLEGSVILEGEQEDLENLVNGWENALYTDFSEDAFYADEVYDISDCEAAAPELITGAGPAFLPNAGSTIIDDLGLKPGTLLNINLAYDGNNTADRKARIDLTLGEAELRVIATEDGLYIRTSGALDSVLTAEDDEGLLDEVFRNGKYIASDLEGLVSLDELSDLSGILSNGGFADFLDLLKDSKAEKETDGDDVTYTFTLSDEAVSSVVLENGLSDALGDTPAGTVVVSRAGTAYTISFGLTGKDSAAYKLTGEDGVSLTANLVIKTETPEIRVPSSAEIVSEEDIRNQLFEEYGAELPTVGAGETDVTGIEEIGPSGEPIQLTSPDLWLSATDSTKFDWSGFMDVDGYGIVLGTFRHDADGVGSAFQAINGFAGATQANRQAVMERYVEQIFSALREDSGLEFEYELNIDNEDYSADCQASSEDGLKPSILLSFQDVPDYDTLQTVSVHYLFSRDKLDAKSVNTSILNCIGVDVGADNIALAVDLADAKQAENAGTYTVYLKNGNGDTLSVSALGRDNDPSNIVISMQTVIQRQEDTADQIKQVEQDIADTSK